MTENGGKFTKGNPGGPGRPRRSIEEKYLKAFNSAFKVEDVKEIVAALIKAALRGDVRAAQLLLSYGLGTPVNRTEILGKDGTPQEFGVVPVDYRFAITPLAPRSVDDSDTPSESESTLDGKTLG